MENTILDDRVLKKHINKEDLTKKQRWEIADKLAEDRLQAINATCQEVHVRNTFYTCVVKCFLMLLSY